MGDQDKRIILYMDKKERGSEKWCLLRTTIHCVHVYNEFRSRVCGSQPLFYSKEKENAIMCTITNAIMIFHVCLFVCVKFFAFCFSSAVRWFSSYLLFATRDSMKRKKNRRIKSSHLSTFSKNQLFPNFRSIFALCSTLTRGGFVHFVDVRHRYRFVCLYVSASQCPQL